jgi:hypothetical protein
MNFCSPISARIVTGAILVATCFATSSSFAQSGGNLTVEQLETSEGNLTVFFNASPGNPAGCAYGISGLSNNGLVVTSADPGNRNYLALLLAAKLTSRPVSVQVHPTSCIWGGWPVLIDVKLY